MTTALEYAASFGRRKPNTDEVTELHRLREQDLAIVSAKKVIKVEDIQSLEWGVRFEVANKFFDQCDEAAKHALLHDQHHGVRSAAALFKPTEKPVPPAASAPATQVSVSEIASVIMNGKQRLATLHGVKTAAGVMEMIVSTHPISLLERAQSFIAGFEDDDMQEGVNELLADLRAALKPRE